jgi:hypothetical protein
VLAPLRRRRWISRLESLHHNDRLHGESKSGRVQREQLDEHSRVACRHFGYDWQSRVVHKRNVEKIVGAYRVMRALGW